MDTSDLSFKIDRKAVKVRKSWGDVNPGVKIHKDGKKKREQNSLNREIANALNGDFDNDEDFE